MDPQSNERSQVNSPPPIHNQLPVPELPSINGQSTQEVSATTSQGEQPNASPNGQAIPAISPPAMAHTPQTSVPIDVTTTTQTVVPSSADDTDLIEKEWVDKAKQIVERNREDPYEQSKELTIFKADYMKKRYNRTIKLGE